MNENETRVEARFAPETRFELRPATVAPFRANLETEFERLKNRLLAEHLATASRAELNAPLRRAANEAAALAWVSFFPLLVFPELFAEKAGTAVRQAARQARIYANSRELVCA
jgi:phage regulator Rha-like protein